MSQMLIDDQDIPLVGIDFMNKTHQQEAEMVNTLARLIEAQLAGEDMQSSISQQLQAWHEHTEAHFSRENELMQQTGFPAYPVHAEEHRIALDRLQAVMDAWRQNHDIELVKDYVFTLWPAWFKGHVNSMDKVTAQFALNNGYRPD